MYKSRIRAGVLGNLLLGADARCAEELDGLGLSISIDMRDSEREPDSDMESSPVPVVWVPCVVDATGLLGRDDATTGSPTKQHLVLTSSMTVSVKTSSGTAVAWGTAELTTPIGGVYRACFSRRARIWLFNREPARGVVRIHEKRGLEPYILMKRYDVNTWATWSVVDVCILTGRATESR